jgi:hypothetical protein
MDMYADEGDIQRSIQTAIRVAAYQWAEYTEMKVGTLSLHVILSSASLARIFC